MWNFRILAKNALKSKNEKKFFILSIVFILSQSLNAKSCDGSTYDMLMCLNDEFEALEEETKNKIALQKDKIPDDNFLALQKSQNAWMELTQNYCNFKYKDGGTIDRLNVLSCIIDDFKKRIKNITTDFESFKILQKINVKKQENTKNSYLNESRILSNNEKILLDKLNAKNDDLAKEKAVNYKNHLSPWKDFASFYCQYQGGGFECLDALYKAKNKLVKKDLEF